MKEEIGFLRQEDIKLNIIIERTSFVRGESIDIKISVTNESPHRFKAEDLSQCNNSLHFYAMNEQKAKFSGSLQSPLIAEGLQLGTESEEDPIIFFPNSEMTAEIDLLDILGELPEGKYELKVTYGSQGILFVKSKITHFNVSKATPIYAATAYDYLRTTSNVIPTSWINQENGELRLILMENSQFFPCKLKSNRRILKLDTAQKVYPSIIEDNEPNTSHLLWAQENTLKVATVEERVLKDVESLKIPTGEFQILPPGFTDQERNVHIAIKSKKTKAIELVSCLTDGEFNIKEICRFEGDFPRYSIIFDEVPEFHLAWASESGDILYTRFNLYNSTRVKEPPKKLITLKPPLLDVQLSKGCENLEGERQLILHLVNFEPTDELHSQFIEVNTMKTLKHCFVPFTQNRGFFLLQTVMDFECNPYYLLQDRKGALWFKGSKGRGFLRITEENDSYPGNIDFPVLLLSSNVNRNYGIYLRYIKDKSRFVYKKLESLS